MERICMIFHLSVMDSDHCDIWGTLVILWYIGKVWDNIMFPRNKSASMYRAFSSRVPWTVLSIPWDCRRTVGWDGRLGHGGRMGGCMGIPRTVLPRDSTIPRNSIQSHGTRGLMGLRGSLTANLDMTDKKKHYNPSSLVVSIPLSVTIILYMY